MACKFSGCRTATKGSHSFEGGSRENSFNNRDLITEPAGERVLPENFEVVERGDTGQGGRVAVISCGGFFDVVGIEGPKVVGIDGGTVELVAEAVEVAHADLAKVPSTAVVGEHTVVVHASGIIAASRVLSVLPDTGHCCRRCRCCHPSNSIPPFSP